MLENEKIILRAPELQDIELLFQWENDQRIWHLSQTLIPYSRFDIEQFILQGNHDIYVEKQFRFMITSKEDQSLLGCVDLFDFDPHNSRVGIGILIDENHRQKGWASEALDVLIPYSFNQLKVHQLYCNVLLSNADSLNLFKRKHFSEIGVKKEWVFHEGKYQDEVLLQLIRKN